MSEWTAALDRAGRERFRGLLLSPSCIQDDIIIFVETQDFASLPCQFECNAELSDVSLPCDSLVDISSVFNDENCLSTCYSSRGFLNSYSSRKLAG